MFYFFVMRDAWQRGFYVGLKQRFVDFMEAAAWKDTHLLGELWPKVPKATIRYQARNASTV